MSDLEHKKYPLGKFEFSEEITDQNLEEHIAEIKNFPSKLRLLVQNFSDEQLNTVYREGGWTVRQLINHLSDSHINSFVRFKLALTEENPTVKPYFEAKWAELQDSRNIGIEPALQILDGLHQRWAHLLKTSTNKEFSKTFYHPEQQKNISLSESVAFYSWHCKHHYAQIENLKKEKNW